MKHTVLPSPVASRPWRATAFRSLRFTERHRTRHGESLDPWTPTNVDYSVTTCRRRDREAREVSCRIQVSNFWLGRFCFSTPYFAMLLRKLYAACVNDKHISGKLVSRRSRIIPCFLELRSYSARNRRAKFHAVFESQTKSFGIMFCAVCMLSHMPVSYTHLTLPTILRV